MIIRSAKRTASEKDPSGSKDTNVSIGHCQDSESSVESVEDYWCLVSEDDAFPEKQGSQNDARSAPVVADKLPSTLGNGDWWNNMLKKPQNLLLLVNLLVGIAALGYLVWDRHAWRTSALQFKSELHQMTEDKTMDVSTLQVVMEEKISDAPPAKEEEPIAMREDVDESLNDFLVDERVQEPQLDPDDGFLVSNCWVRAKASFSFGECASDARENLKDLKSEVVDTVGIFAKRTWRAASKWKKKVGTAIDKAAATARDKMQDHQQAGITMDAAAEASASIASAIVAAVDASAHAIMKARVAMDGPIHHFAGRASDAIEEATAPMRPRK